MKVGEYLFKGFDGCTNHSCIIKKPEGMGTNGTCHCLQKLTKQQQATVNRRLKTISGFQINKSST